MGLTTTPRQKKQRRKGPYPNSILDRPALEESLEQAGVSLKRNHFEAFYQALHRQHYPSLEVFVENYYSHERKELSEGDNQATNKPLKNPVSNRKNKNRMQLPKPFLNFLLKTPDFVTMTTKIQQKMVSSDRSTTKLIVELHDGQVVESVLMRYEQKGAGRASLCVSSQVGCAMGCTFCATGTMGLFGNLTTAEILEQMIHANNILAAEYKNFDGSAKKLDLVRNVVFMGMGEPLDNYNNVVAACRAMMDRKRWNLAHGRITVSTVGLISQIRKLTRELPEVSLALSLHAPNQDARTAIVPTATRYPIEQLIDALDDHMMAYLTKKGEESYTEEERIKEGTRKRAMIEYVMLEGETSSLECAHQLGRLCQNRHLVVNLIPYNATDVKDKLQCPSKAHTQKFRDIVASYGTFCTIRRTMGADIASACGQLVQKKQEEEDSSNAGAAVVVDIEDVVRGGARKGSDIEDVVVRGAARRKGSDQGSTMQSVPSENFEPTSSIISWLGSIPSETLDQWAGVLGASAAVSASCFLASAVVFFVRRK